jgi:ComF family protein
MGMSLWSDLFQLLFPQLCASCDHKLTDGESFVCLGCLHRIPRTGYSGQRDNPLERLFAGRLPFERVASYAYFSKEGMLQKMVHELKYGDNPGLGEFLGQLSYREMSGGGFFESVDLLVPVPLHPKRLKKRGYNQSFHIAKGISSSSGIPVLEGILTRTINNPSQTSLSQTERWANVDGVFSVKNPQAFAGKHILLVDDILTTGSTLESCARRMLTETQLKISVLVLGSTI